MIYKTKQILILILVSVMAINAFSQSTNMDYQSQKINNRSIDRTIEKPVERNLFSQTRVEQGRSNLNRNIPLNLSLKLDSVYYMRNGALAQ